MSTFVETGSKDDGSKPRLGLIHPMLLIQTAHVLAEGDRHYGEGNWKGLRISRIVDAMDRHLLAIKSGEDIDPKSGKPHVAHIASGCSFLSWMMENGKTGSEQDDRPWLNSKPKTYGVDMASQPDVSVAVMVEVKDGKSVVQNIDMPHFAEDTFPVRHEQVRTLIESGNQLARAADSIKILLAEIVDWADGAIGTQRTYNDAIRKLTMEELPELLLDPKSPLEWADVAIIVLDLAHLADIDVASAVRHKLEINRGRTFALNSRTGLYRHVGPDDEPPLVLGEAVRLKGDQSGTAWTLVAIWPARGEARVERQDGDLVSKAMVELADLEPA